MKEPPSQLRWAQRYAGTLSPEETEAFEEYLQETPSARLEDEEHRALHQRLHRREGFEALLQQGLAQLEGSKERPEISSLEVSENSPTARGDEGDGWWARLSLWWSQGLMPVAAGLCVLAIAFSSPLWRGAVETPGPSHRVDPVVVKRVVGPVPPRRSLAQPGPAIQAKSRKVEFGMLFMRRGTKRTYKARPHQVLGAGDLIQFVYRTGRPLHVMIVSLNAKGEVSRYVPFTGKPQSVTISIGKGLLPKTSDALELDDSVGAERLFFVYGARRFSYQSLEQALRAGYRKAGRRLDKIAAITGPWRWRSLMIHKRPQTSVAPLSPDHK